MQKFNDRLLHLSQKFKKIYAEFYACQNEQQKCDTWGGRSLKTAKIASHNIWTTP